MPGTSADLCYRDWLTIEDLFYAMMLPSGNDAAMVLGENFGVILDYERIGKADVLKKLQSIDVTNSYSFLSSYRDQFIRAMNTFATSTLKLQNTRFINCHGMDPPIAGQAYSTPYDIAATLKHAYRSQLCLKVMSALVHRAEIRMSQGRQYSTRVEEWTNTNRLLGTDMYVGGKTGQTTQAGNCLASIVKKNNQLFFAVVLGCAKKPERFTETSRLIEAYLK